MSEFYKELPMTRSRMEDEFHQNRRYCDLRARCSARGRNIDACQLGRAWRAELREAAKRTTISPEQLRAWLWSPPGT